MGNKMVDVSRKESEKKKKVASALSISGAEILLGCEQVHELPHSQKKNDRHAKMYSSGYCCYTAAIVFSPVNDTHMSSQTTYKYVATGNLFGKVLFGSLMSENLNNNYMIMFHLKVSTMRFTASAI